MHQVISVPVQTPAAGAEITYTVPGQWYQRVLAGAWQLRTSATAGDRAPAVAIEDPDGALCYMGSTGAFVAASTTITMGFAPASTSTLLSFVQQWTSPLPSIWLPPGWKVLSQTVSLSVGDQYSAGHLIIEQVPTRDVEATEGRILAGIYIEPGA